MVTAKDAPATLHKCAEPKCPIVGALPEGVPVLVFEEHRGWYWVDVPRKYREAGEFTTVAWVREADVQPVAPPAVDAAPARTQSATAASEATPIAAAPVGNCLACAATKPMNGDITLTIEGDALTEPGSGDRHYDENMAQARATLEPQLVEARDLANRARANWTKYLTACYGKYTRSAYSGGTRVVVQSDRTGSWTAMATSTSRYAWRESWVGGVAVSNETTTFCRSLWSDVVSQADEVRTTAAGIQAQARDLDVWPLVTHRLLAEYGLK
jgi:hypothetical protein